MNSSEESALLLRIAQKDDSALEILYTRYSKLLYGFILSILKSADEAEDILQEIFIRVWNRAPAFDATKGSVYTWLVTMARNRAIDRLRSKDYQTQRQTSLSDSENEGEELFQLVDRASEDEDPLDATIASERALLVRKAFDEIHPDQRRILQLAYFSGFSQSEIAAELQIPLGTVKTRMRQGMIKMHTLISKRI